MDSLTLATSGGGRVRPMTLCEASSVAHCPVTPSPVR